MAKISKTEINSKKISWLLYQPMETKLEILNQHLEISRMLINDLLEEEVCRLSGVRYSHDKPEDGRYSRWGFNPGSVKLGDEKIRISVPRVYDNVSKGNVSLETYKEIKETPKPVDDRLLRRVLLGLSMADYGTVIQELTDSFGLSSSSVSRAFKEQSEQKLKEFEDRKFYDQEYVAIFIDGKYLAREQMVIVLGVTIDGRKIPLGFIQTHTENSESIRELLSQLVERGLNYRGGLLCIIDGSKGICKAVKEVFGDYALILRCQWHKRENILSYLNERDQEIYRKRLNKAYQSDSYQEAKQQLQEIHQDLCTKNVAAARSLEEGLEETLTLHRLGLIEQFRRSFTTTNCIENLNSQLGKHIGKVKNWSSEQRYRWVACSLLEIEKRMRKVDNHQNLHLLKERIKQEIDAKITKKQEAA